MPDDKKPRFRAGVGKVIITVFGIIVLGMGLYSHFNSDWRFVNKSTTICEEHKGSYYASWGSNYKSCPPFETEEYFVAAITICFILSLASLCFFTVIKNPSNFIRKVDIGYHFLGAVMLIIAGSLYLTSSIQVLHTQGLNYYDGKKLDFKFGNKLIAGVITIIQGLVYCIVAVYILKGNNGNAGYSPAAV